MFDPATSLILLRPWWLISFIPLIALLLWQKKSQLQSKSWQKSVDAHLLPHLLKRSDSQADYFGKSWLLPLALALTIIALSGPSWSSQQAEVKQDRSALVVLLDLSLSMNARDVQPNRIDSAKLKIRQLLQQQLAGEQALIVYAGDSFIVSPLTEDSQTIISQLQVMQPELIPEEARGSRTDLAIAKAVELLQQAKISQAQLVLFTDEAGSERDLQAAQQLAGGFRLSVIAVGTEQGAPIPLPGSASSNSAGNSASKNSGSFIKQQGQIIVAKLDIAELRNLAANGGGLFSQLQTNDSDIELLKNLQTQDAQRQAEKQHSFKQRQDGGFWLLPLIILLLLPSFRKGWLASIAVIFLLPTPAPAFEWNDLWQTKNQQGYQQFKQQNFQQAQQDFSSEQWKAAAAYKAGDYQTALDNFEKDPSAQGLYNQGNSLMQLGEYEKAIERYENGLTQAANHAEMKDNLALAKKLLEQQQQQNQQQDKDSEQQSDQEQKDSDQDQSKKDQSSESDQKDASSKEEQSQQASNDPSEQQSEQDQKQAEQDQKSDDQQDPAEESQLSEAEQAEKREQQEKLDEDLQQRQAELQQQIMQDQETEKVLQQLRNDPALLWRNRFQVDAMSRESQQSQSSRQQEVEKSW
ncbi:vWA domain-containing protein [Pelagibaculum spongiae]|uniref:VWFA domain-containing protein n=1 Tax=Pelagibaculum spongiae TaxID=2080658 RepID=A0A2V1GVD7_9GAMM|nr:VWA domain-containing protein [Pelagibaculum spongiae]PVZ64309.1 hypothetical protein DC094_19790 [Pelagibaculum spongiae]